jgi:AraC family transcriptional regulator of adaptative response/methylated-DNA-[protein]-cysteine methyltransferase
MKMQDKFDFKKINGWLKEYKTEQLTAYLEPSYIKAQIEKPGATTKNYSPSVIIEIMTQEEYEGRTEQLNINYSFKDGRFGKVMIASATKGVCYMGFADDEKEGVQELKRRFPYANYVSRGDAYQDNAFSVFDKPEGNEKTIRLHLKGTSFQINTWKKLLQIPFGELVSYASLAGDVKRSRATGTAVGDNPVGFLIPCHRVVRATGEFGQYYWGADRKAALISWEAAMANETILSKKRVLSQPLPQ